MELAERLHSLHERYQDLAEGCNGNSDIEIAQQKQWLDMASGVAIARSQVYQCAITLSQEYECVRYEMEDDSCA
jgi:hypothetical protein